MKVYASERFLDAYRAASVGLKGLTEGAVHKLIMQHYSNSAVVLHQYDRLAHMNERVIEIDLGKSCRLLADYSQERLILLDMGEHEIVRKYSRQKRKHDLGNYRDAPVQFWPGRSDFFRRNPDRTIPIHYEEERSQEWLYFLEAQQAKVDEQITNEIWKYLDKGNPISAYLVMGGPGTGKSCILFNLLRFFAELCHAGIVVSDRLAEYVENSTGANLSQFRVDLNNLTQSYDLLLVDDPASVHEIRHALRLQLDGKVGAVVIAFDPLQLEEALPDSSFNRLVKNYKVQPLILNTCYRQKENVGRNTKHVIDKVAASTPYYIAERTEEYHNQHKQLTTQANDLLFANPAGYVQYYPDASVEDIQQEVRRILNYEWLLWKHTPGLLVVEGLGNSYVLSEQALAALKPLNQRNDIEWISLDEIEKVKGLEFQHVFLFLDSELFIEIQNGFSGSGRRVYNDRRLLRIPFSRAKDSLVTFALKQA